MNPMNYYAMLNACDARRAKIKRAVSWPWVGVALYAVAVVAAVLRWLL